MSTASIHVDRRIDAGGVIVLDQLVLQRAAAAFVRFDNGPEFIAHAVNGWCRYSMVPLRCSLIPDRRGRTLGSNRSTGVCATSCSTRGASDSPLEARVITEDW